MKIRINFFAEPSEPNVEPSLIACPTGDFASLEEASDCLGGWQQTRDSYRVPNGRFCKSRRGASDCLGGWQQTRDHGAFDYYRVFG